MEDHYFGQIKDRISEFMKSLDIELWKMGITSKTKHNEVAPSQFEMAPIFATTNIAADHNQLVMETMQKVALRHGLACLLHEKPYAGVNGSGKHNNWSLSTDDGQNLLEPGSTPHDNEQFLMFLSALITAVDRHAELLRATAACSGNDHRLGANEAPPAIVSIFMGTELTEVLESVASGRKRKGAASSFVRVGVDTLPPLPRDNSDRNRTSPFAFTGNKFEFRMVASSASVSGPNVVLNTIAAEALDEIATRLEKAKDIHKEATAIVRDAMKKHGRIIFNGNNYSPDWVREAAKRGLPNIASTADALEAIASPQAIKLFGAYKVLAPREVRSRHEIYVEQYCKQINIEAMTALDMVRTQYIPAVVGHISDLAASVCVVQDAGGSAAVQKALLDKASALLESAYDKTDRLDRAAAKARTISALHKQAVFYRDSVMAAMKDLRADIDALEMMVPRSQWPVPTYADMLFKL
jgi:glutamine synthetase